MTSEPYAEQALVACILSQPEILGKLTARTTDFTDPTLSRVYSTMLSLTADDLTPDLPTIAGALFDAGADAGKISAYLVELQENLGSGVAWEQYDRQVREAGTKAELLRLSERVAAMARNGASASEIVAIVREQTDEIEAGIRSNDGLTEKIKALIKICEGTVTYQLIDSELGLKTQSEKNLRRKIFERLAGPGGTLKKGGRPGQFIKLDTELQAIDLTSESNIPEYGIRLPFGLEKYVIIYPKNIIVLAGEKGVGKTSLALEVARLNMGRQPVRYLNSEMDEAELKARLRRYQERGICPFGSWKQVFFSEPKSFLDNHVDPDGLNIIDYLEVTDEFYRVACRIRDIFDTLRNGVCVILLQKDPKKEMGVGGVFSREKARLYLNLIRGKGAGDYSQARVDVGKNWRTDQNPRR